MKSTKQVLLFLPNIIDYGRILLLVQAFTVYDIHPSLFFIFYALSAFLDAADGYVARAAKQTSHFGSILDFTCDRISAIVMMGMLAGLYPGFNKLLMVLISLDIASHFIHLYNNLFVQRHSSHKQMEEGDFAILRFCYRKYVLFTLCFGNEAFMLLMYVCYHCEESFLGVGFVCWASLAVVMLPLCIAKHMFHVVQLANAVMHIARYDAMQKM
jgi:CDP-diacylglycerol--inositol 3-phosphatidyltransferase